jgi:hypothetical protein
MRHKALVLSVVVAQMTQIRPERQGVGKVLEVTGDARVNGVAATVDDSRPGKQRGDDPQVLVVERHFVDYAGELTAALPLLTKVLLGHGPPQGRIEPPEAVGVLSGTA